MTPMGHAHALGMPQPHPKKDPMVTSAEFDASDPTVPVLQGGPG
jgi:hypothetical protein